MVQACLVCGPDPLYDYSSLLVLHDRYVGSNEDVLIEIYPDSAFRIAENQGGAHLINQSLAAGCYSGMQPKYAIEAIRIIPDSVFDPAYGIGESIDELFELATNPYAEEPDSASYRLSGTALTFGVIDNVGGLGSGIKIITKSKPPMPNDLIHSRSKY
jgi:hypothetical protein